MPRLKTSLEHDQLRLTRALFESGSRRRPGPIDQPLGQL